MYVVYFKLWIKDISYGKRTTDNYGSPAFAIINNATGQALKHGKEKDQQVKNSHLRLKLNS